MKRLKLLGKALAGNTQEKYESRHELLVSLGHRLGIRVYNRNLAWHRDAEFLELWKKFPDGGDVIPERKFNLYYLAKTLINVEGDIAECGVFRGGSSFLMLSATAATNKHFFGFDSFEGLSEPSEIDSVDNERTFKWQKHDLSVDASIASQNLQGFEERVSLLKGWIPSRFQEVKDRRFCLVHIDVDLYEPTMATLEFFYPRLTPGGMIVCDDYGSEGCPGAYQAMNEFGQRNNSATAHLTTGQGVLFKH